MFLKLPDSQTLAPELVRLNQQQQQMLLLLITGIQRAIRGTLCEEMYFSKSEYEAILSVILV